MPIAFPQELQPLWRAREMARDDEVEELVAAVKASLVPAAAATRTFTLVQAWARVPQA